jgi:signal transduction histidine kinase
MNPPVENRNRRVIVIDDSRAICEDFLKILGGENADATSGFDDARAAFLGEAASAAFTAGAISFEVDCAYQGKEGLEYVRKAVEEGRPYALAFVDVRMPPGWDGIETIGHLWEVAPDLQVVVCTAYSDYSWDDMIEKLGRTDRLLILKKPFDNMEVSQLACAMTEKWNLARETREHTDRLEQTVRQRTGELEQQKDYLEDALARLQESHAQLLQAEKLKSIGQLAAGIAHEINTPTQYVGDNTRFLQENVPNLFSVLDQYVELLGADKAVGGWEARAARIKASLEELDMEFLKEEIPKAIGQSLEGIERVAAIVRSMKEFSHPGGREMHPADLNRAIETTLMVAQNEWKYVADVVTDFDAALPLVPCLLGDFNQVILNIVINAVHAIADVVGKDSGEKGTITVTTRQDDGWAEIRISDTGTGISEEDRSKVFDHFFTTKEVGKGTGQGLAIAYGVVVEKHKGTITLETEMGKGTTFIIRLPVDGDAVASKEERQLEEAQAP